MGVVPMRWTGLFASLIAVSASAQTGGPPTAGAISDTLKRPPELQAPAPLASPALPRPARPVADPGGKTVTVQRFEFRGNTLFTAAQLEPLLKAYLGRPLGLTELYEATDRVTDHYVAAGYALASALLPAQKISEGTVQIEIIEGRVDKIVYEGLKQYRAEDLDFYVGNSAGQVYQGARFEQGLRQVDALPGLDARAVLRPGSTYGTTDIVVRLQEDPFQALFFVDNHGRDTVGETRFATQLTFNSPMRLGDRFTLMALRSSDNLLQYLSGDYSVPLGWRGARLNLNYGYAEFELAGPFAGVAGKNRSGRAAIELPLLRSGSEELTLTGGVSSTQADTDFTGIPLRGTDLTLLELGASYTRAHAGGGVTQISTGLGSNFKKSDGSDPDAQRIRLDLDLQHVEPLPMSLQLVGRGLFLYSPDPLPDTQQFSLGGPGTVRGYAPSEVRGDWGYFGSLTLQRSVMLGAALVTPRLFVDAGTVRSRAPGGTVPEVSLSSVGIGADAALDRISLKLDYAIPTDSVPVSDGKDDGRVYGTVAVEF